MYSAAIFVLCLAILLPLPVYFVYCHLNKKETDTQVIQNIAFSGIIPAITLLTYDEFLDPGVACVLFGAVAGYLFAKLSFKAKE
ncbi:MAG: hypothetical protein KA155_09440 [Alphaproteobacteria bacterium]|jgi:hypothetical protein|nr:hypothetical protein [Alphaproteobacteria bacterium]